jgi:hypothetical protein
MVNRRSNEGQRVVRTQTHVTGQMPKGAASQMKQKLFRAKAQRRFRPTRIIRQKLRRLDEAGPDDLLDDWMVSGPAAEPPSSS